MSAKAGYIDPQLAERVLQKWIQSTFPQEVSELQAEAQAQAEMQAQMQAEMPPELQAQMQGGEQSPEELDKMIALSQMLNGQAQPQQSRPRTQAATESLMRGMTPAM